MEKPHHTKKKPGMFWLGLLVSLAGWMVDIGFATVIYSILIFQFNMGGEHFSIFTGLSKLFGILLAVIWVPVAVIAGFRSWKKGFNAALPLVIITCIAAPLLVGCGFGMLVAAFG